MLSFSDVRTSTAASLPSNSSEALSKSANSSAEDTKINKSARDFEAILLSNWLQQAEESFAKVPGGEEDEDDRSSSQFTQMGMQSLGTSFAATGGIGIARMIAAQLHKTEGTASSTVETEGRRPSTLPPDANFLPPALNNARETPIR